MPSTYRVRQVWLPDNIDYTGNFFSRNLAQILNCHVEFTRDSEAYVDAEIVGVFSHLPSILDRYHEKLRQRLRLVKGYPFIHGGLNRDVAVKYDMRNPPSTKNYKKRIWFSGENIRPPFGFDYDATISFDLDTFHDSNIYGPISYLLLSEKPSWIDPLLGLSIDTEKLKLARKFPNEVLGRKLACAFVGNDHSMRLRFIEELKKFGDVDVFGSAVGRPVKNKASLAGQYKFVICFENDLYPGYITEKLVHAYLCDSVPLYWGDIQNDHVFNKASFMNLHNFDSIESFAYFVGNMSEEDYIERYRQPLVLKTKPIEEMLAKIKEAFTKPSSYNRI
jgi:Glycosyltransferase family 10 (fucosyltransferase) C-term